MPDEYMKLIERAELWRGEHVSLIIIRAHSAYGFQYDNRTQPINDVRKLRQPRTRGKITGKQRRRLAAYRYHGRAIC